MMLPCASVSHPSRSTIANPVITVLFAMGGFKFQGHLRQESGGVLVDIKANLPHNVSARWQIHELPVDFSVDPKLRCRSEYVGRALPYSGISGELSTINGKTTASLILHSIVLYVDDQPAACGSIVPFILPASAGFIDINSGVFGRIYVVQWPGECMPQILCTLLLSFSFDLLRARCTVCTLKENLSEGALI